MTSRRGAPRRIARVVAALAIVAALLVPGTGPALAAPGVALVKIAEGFDSPVQLTNAQDGSGRLFVVEQTGRIKVLKDGVLLGTFLNVADELSIGGERGLLGLAFHPNYESNGYFYVNFTRSNGDTVINRYRVSSTNPNAAVRSSAFRIMTIGQPPYDNHKGGMLAFGPDGYLYIGTGDGGSSGDPGNRGQRTDTLLGKMLRIDVNGTTSSRNYRVPSSNPYVGKTGWDEIWSRGLRNPWRFSFDRATGTLWIGDVGQDDFEEINRATNTGTSATRGRGANYGWRVLEGRHCYNPSSGCNRSGKHVPVVEYAHNEGCSVTAGYVYRGSRVPALANRYIFGDYCSGTIWAISAIAGIPATKGVVLSTSMHISSFGEDGSGELYVVDHDGAFYKFVATT
jgi:glucose/arabinose dehydrogenase